MTEAKPKRRWFRFSLRTLFVAVAILSVPLGWVAYQLNWIRQRESFVTTHGVGRLDMFFNKTPWSLRLFGEQNVDYLMNVPVAYVEQARALFPETIVNPKPTDFPQMQMQPIAPSIRQ